MLMSVGADFGIGNAGHYAINSMRLEKGYRAWGADLSPDDTPLEAGLSFAVDWSRDFLGREALLLARKQAQTKRLATFVLKDPDAVLWGSEPIMRNGEPVGYTTSGAYGFTLGASIGMGCVNNDDGVTRGEYLESGEYEIETNGARIGAKLWLRAPYDPGRARIMV